jgi:hypothetical protein
MQRADWCNQSEIDHVALFGRDILASFATVALSLQTIVETIRGTIMQYAHCICAYKNVYFTGRRPSVASLVPLMDRESSVG